MKKLFVSVCVAIGLVAPLHALPILLNTTPLPGTQPANQGQQTVADWLDSLNGPTDTIGLAADLEANSGDPSPAPGYPGGTFGSSIILPVGDYDYLVLHWGGPGGGTDYAYSLVGCLDGSTAVFTNPNGKNGLSSFRFYRPNKVKAPDLSSTLGLLTVGIATLAIHRRLSK